MNFERLKSIVEKISSNEQVKAMLAKHRAQTSPSRSGEADETRNSSQVRENIFKALTGVTFVIGIIGGRTARRIEAVIFLVGLLVELSLIFKHEVIDDPEVQKMIQEAWIELERQSRALYMIGRGLVDRSLAKLHRRPAAPDRN